MTAVRLEVHLPVFNEEAHLPKMLDCLRRQTFQDFRVVIHDNGSTDGTPGICLSAAERDPRIEVRRYPVNRGTHRQGLRIWYGSTAEFIAIRSANDRIADSYLEQTLALLDANPSIGLAYSYGSLMDDNDSVVAIPGLENRIDTRAEEGSYGRAVHVMRRYGYSFPLWGVYRQRILDRLRCPQFSYASDHVTTCEVALYSDIAATNEPLDFRRITRNEVNFYPDGVRSWARQASEEVSREVPDNSPYSSMSIHLPLTNLVWGHIDMLSLALIPESEKMRLGEEAIVIFCERFGRFLRQEIATFTEMVLRDLPSFLREVSAFPPHVRALRLGKLRTELNKLAVIPFAPRHELGLIEKEIASYVRGT